MTWLWQARGTIDSRTKIITKWMTSKPVRNLAWRSSIWGEWNVLKIIVSIARNIFIAHGIYYLYEMELTWLHKQSIIAWIICWNQKSDLHLRIPCNAGVDRFFPWAHSKIEGHILSIKSGIYLWLFYSLRLRHKLKKSHSIHFEFGHSHNSSTDLRRKPKNSC